MWLQQGVIVPTATAAPPLLPRCAAADHVHTSLILQLAVGAGAVALTATSRLVVMDTSSGGGPPLKTPEDEPRSSTQRERESLR